MYSRELVIQLREWKSRRNHKPLVLRGARQVGKTTLVKEFGKEFDVFIYLNLEKKDAEIFQHFDRANDIWQYLQLKHHVTQIKDTSILLFIDEIQEEPKAVSMLRYFYEELPWLHVIAAGSRLQSLLKKRVSFPVGRVEYLSLRPFSFVEYIHVFENEEWQQMLKNQVVPSFLHDDMMRHFNQYALIGGMPEAIAEFATTNSIERLSPIFHSLIKGYNEDAEKYAKNEEQVRILRHILSTVWNTTSQTVTFGQFGNSSYTSTQIHDGMDLLEKAFLLSLDYPITTTSAPAIPAKRRSPKLIMLDSGLTNFMAGIQTEFLLNKDLLDTWRGKAAEQIVAQELRIVLDRHYQESQHFWVRDKQGATAEVDFIWQLGTHIVPIEVKAGTNSHLRSLHAFVNHCEQQVTAVRVWSGEFSVQDITTPAPENRPFRLINLPFYYVGQMDNVLEQHAW